VKLVKEANVGLNSDPFFCLVHNEKKVIYFYDRPGGPPGNGLVCQSCQKGAAMVGHTILQNESIQIGKDLNSYSKECHIANQKWWHDIKTGERLNRNFGELIALCHSELSEALEGHRKDLMDDKLPNRKMAEVELADCLIRIFDLAEGFGFDLQGAYTEKMAYNAQRADHKPENRILPGGKKY
jgi:plasmid maintenance system antidote protein VapI